MDPNDDPLLVGNDLNMGTSCLQALNRVDEIDEFREKVVDLHKNNWRLLQAAAQNYLNDPHHGFIVAGKFIAATNAAAETSSMPPSAIEFELCNLMVQAIPLAQKDENHAEVGGFYLALAEMLLNNRGYSEAWRLQYLSDLKTLPDYEPGWSNYRQSSGAPVDADGKPVFHTVPKDFDSAETDGQRWRWCLQQAVEFDPSRLNAVRYAVCRLSLSTIRRTNH